jgi:RNA-directed DNA polymerase
MYGWNPETWRETERRVFKLQKRIYQASRRGDAGCVHGLQRLNRPGFVGDSKS